MSSHEFIWQCYFWDYESGPNSSSTSFATMDEWREQILKDYMQMCCFVYGKFPKAKVALLDSLEFKYNNGKPIRNNDDPPLHISIRVAIRLHPGDAMVYRLSGMGEQISTLICTDWLTVS